MEKTTKERFKKAFKFLSLGCLFSFLAFCFSPIRSRGWVSVPDVQPALSLFGATLIITFGKIVLPCIIPTTLYLKRWWREGSVGTRILGYMIIGGLVFFLLYIWNLYLSK